MADTSRGTSPKSDHHIHGFARVAKALTNPDNVATWVQIAIPETYSGYKAHIYCEDPEDVIWVLRRIWDVIADLQLGAKAGTMRFFELTQPDDAGNPHPQTGKAVVVYFPRRRTWRQDLQRICDALEGSRHDDKGIMGANVERNGVSWRFELTYDPGEDVDRARYLKLYQPA